MDEHDKIRFNILKHIKENDKKINHQDLTSNFLKSIPHQERETIVGNLSGALYIQMLVANGHGIGYSVTERGLEKIKEYKSLKIKETFRKDIPIIVSILSLVI
ncbi:MAG: hypothetical protein ACYDEC_00730, partial [Bacteroidia bacterium]